MMADIFKLVGPAGLFGAYTPENDREAAIPLLRDRDGSICIRLAAESASLGDLRIEEVAS